jgi:hypothetical protein
MPLYSENLVAQAALHHQAWLREHEPVLERLHQGFSGLGESGLSRGDMLSLAATALEYRPDLVLELGRGLGTSTALFHYLDIPVVSVCRTSFWRDRTVAMLAEIEPLEWERGVNAIVGEISEQDYGSLLHGATRPLIFWDAHGYDVAECVFRKIMPTLADREVLVACHDMRDSRYYLRDRPPEGSPLWRSQQEPYDRFLRIGDVHSSFEQLVSIVDFVSWNEITLHSPTHEIMTNPDALALFPISGVGWPYCLWHYFIVSKGRARI